MQEAIYVAPSSNLQSNQVLNCTFKFESDAYYIQSLTHHQAPDLHAELRGQQTLLILVGQVGLLFHASG